MKLTGDGSEEQRAAAESVNLTGSGDGDDDVEHSLPAGERKLLVLVGDTSALVDGVHVVGKNGISRVLGDDSEGDDNGQAPAIALGSKEIRVARLVSNFFLEPHCFFDFAILELHSRVVAVASTVPFGKNIKAFIESISGDEESWGLGND